MRKKDEQIGTPENQELESLEQLETANSEPADAAAEQTATDAETKEAQTENSNENKTKKEKASTDKVKKNQKLKNKNLAKRSTFLIIFTLVLIGVLALVNALSTILAQRFPTTIDVTADSSNSLTPENIEFIRSIEEEVEIIVCATREGYTGSEMINYAYNYYYVREDSTPYNYFNQTITLIESYPKYNSKIKVSYVDIQSPKFNTLESELDIDVTYGNILVRCTRDVGGKPTTNTSVITFEDIYGLYDASGGYAAYGGGYYLITASDIESQLSSAIYTVAASQKKQIALLTGHAADNASASLVQSLQSYNFEITEIEGQVTASSLEDVDTVLLVSPVSDLSAAELDLLDDFLDNDGQRGKNFFVFGSVSAPATPNLDQFMEEWGIYIEDGISYETNTRYRDGDTILLFNQEDDLTKNVNASELLYLSAGNIALSEAYEDGTHGSRTSHILMTTSPSAVIAPKGTTSGYTPPSTAKVGEIPVIMVTSDVAYDDNTNELTSYVGYFASSDFISSAWAEYSGVGNTDYTLTVINATSGRDIMYFLPKITGAYSMTLSDAQKTAVTIVTLYVLPLLVLAGGVLIWILRKNR